MSVTAAQHTVMHYVQEHYFKDSKSYAVCNINKTLMLQVEHLITSKLAVSSLNQALGALRGPVLPAALLLKDSLAKLMKQ